MARRGVRNSVGPSAVGWLRGRARRGWESYRTGHRRRHDRSVSALIRLDARLIPAVAALWVFTAFALLGGTFETVKVAAVLCIVALAVAVGALYLPEGVGTSVAERPGHSGVQPTGVRRVWRSARPYVVFMGVWVRGAAPQAVAHLCLIALVLVAQSVLLTARGIDTDRSTLRQVQGASVRITGMVSEVRAADARTSLILLKAETAQLGHEVVPLGETVRVYQAAARKNTRSAAGSGKITPTPGTRVTVIGTVENRGAAAYLKEAYVYAPGEVVNPSNTAILRTTLREHAVARIGAEPAALTLGMAYGDDSAMPKTTRENYKLSGLSHLTAVSGANIAIMFLLGYRVGLLLRLPRRSLVFAGAGAVAAYTMLLGFEGSVVRSLTMGALGALALIRGTGRNTLSALTTALLLCLVFSPSLALDMGFALSAVATASLVLVAPSLTRLLSAVLPHTLAELMAAATSASLWCAPLIVGMSGNVPLYGVAANLLAAPLVPLTMFAGLAAFGAWAAGFTPLADASLTVAALPAGLIERVSTFFAKAPGNPWQVEASAAAVAVASAAVLGVSVLFWAGDAWQYRRSHHGQWARENTRIPNERSVQDGVRTPQNSARLIRAHAHPEASAQPAPPRPLQPGLKSPTRIARRTPPRYDG